MWSTATPRNTTINSNSGAGSTLSVVLSPTTTLAGDIGIIFVGVNTTGTLSVTPPSGWSTLLTRATGTFSLSIMYQNPLAGGVSSLTVSAGGTVVKGIIAVYACWPGPIPLVGSANSGLDGSSNNFNVVGLGGGSNPINSLTTSTALSSTELVTWSCVEGFSAGTTAPGTPTGTGTWTSVNSGSSAADLLGISVAAQIVTSGTSATASGASGSSGAAQVYEIIGVYGPPAPGPIESPQAVKRAAFFFNWTPPWQNRKSGLVVPGFADKRLAIP